MAADIAPGCCGRTTVSQVAAARASTWAALLTKARDRREAGLRQLPPIHGYDHDPRAIRAARTTSSAPSCRTSSRQTARSRPACAPDDALPKVEVIANRRIGERLRRSPRTAGALRRTRPRRSALLLPQLAGGGIHRQPRTRQAPRSAARATHAHALQRRHRVQTAALPRSPSSGSCANAFRSPIPRNSAGGGDVRQPPRKDLKHFGRWAKRAKLSCYRLYDADLHEYNLAIGVYEGAKRWAHVQEYEAPQHRGSAWHRSA